MGGILNRMRVITILGRYIRCIRIYSLQTLRERLKMLKLNLNSANKSRIMLKEK
jgi:hypothetical protein